MIDKKAVSLDLNDVLDREGNWQKSVYDALGVYCTKFDSHGTALIYSPCGFSSIQCRIEPEDNRAGHFIKSVAELIDAIKSMEDYKTVLEDVKLATFSKSELFTAVYHQILLLNTDNDELVIGLDYISAEKREGNTELDFNFSVCGVDSLAIAPIGIIESDSIRTAVDKVAEELREAWKYTIGKDEGSFRYDPNGTYKVPMTLQELSSESKHYIH